MAEGGAREACVQLQWVGGCVRGCSCVRGARRPCSGPVRTGGCSPARRQAQACAGPRTPFAGTAPGTRLTPTHLVAGGGRGGGAAAERDHGLPVLEADAQLALLGRQLVGGEEGGALQAWGGGGGERSSVERRRVQGRRPVAASVVVPPPRAAGLAARASVHHCEIAAHSGRGRPGNVGCSSNLVASGPRPPLPRRAAAVRNSPPPGSA